MKRIKEFLRDDYRKNILNISEDCLSFEELCDYIKGASSMKERVESHLAKCYRCLDRLVSIHDGHRFYKRRYRLKKEGLFLIIALVCFLSSFIFSRYFLQFLAATIVLGIKWIVDSKSSKILVMIYEAYKKGGEREAGRVLKDIETKKRIDL